MPIKKYFAWVGGILLCMMLLLDAYLPKAPPRNDYDFDRTGLRITAIDTGIAPDTGAIAISSQTEDAAGVPAEAGRKVAASAAATQAFAKIEPTEIEPAPPRKPQHKRIARYQKPARPAKSPSTSKWSYNRSSQWSYDWSADADWRGPAAKALLSNTRRQSSKQAGSYAQRGDWNFNFARGRQKSSGTLSD